MLGKKQSLDLTFVSNKDMFFYLAIGFSKDTATSKLSWFKALSRYLHGRGQINAWR